MSVQISTPTTLSIDDSIFAIKKLMSDSSGKNIVRELTQNAIECNNSSKLIIQEINVKNFPEKKVLFLNDGLGMTEEDINDQSKLFGSKKNPNRTLDGNNNTGSRLSGLIISKLGIIVLSKHNSELFACKIHRDDDWNIKFERIYKNDKDDLVKDYGLNNNISGDWNAVILLGNTKSHNTFKNPISNEENLEDFLENLISNRYFEEKIETFLKNKKINFIYDNTIKNAEKKWIFKTDMAEYMIFYSENWKDFKPKSGIIFDNEIFDLKTDGGMYNDFIKNSSVFMEDIGAYSIKENLSIFIKPNKDYFKKLRMNHERLGLYFEEAPRKELKLSLFSEEIYNNLPKELEKIIEEKENGYSEKIEISEEMKNDLMEIINERGFKLTEKSLNKSKKIEKDLFYENLKKEFPIIHYDLIIKSKELNINENELRETIINFINNLKFDILKMKNKIKYKKFLNLLEKNLLISRSLNTEGFTNLLFELISLDKEILKEKNIKNSYLKLLDFHRRNLKNDISIKIKKNKNSKNEEREFKELNSLILTSEGWEKRFSNLENYQDFFALFDKHQMIVNIDHRYFNKIKDSFNGKRKLKTVVNTMIIPIITKVFETYGGYYSFFKVLPEKEDLRIIEDEEARNYVYTRSGEILLSAQRELTKYIKQQVEYTQKQTIKNSEKER